MRRFRKAIWFLAGAIAFLLGLAGMILPAVPGVVFLIVAAACFARSSPRFERWLVEHAYLGPPIRHWRATGSIPRKAKWLAIGSMTVSLAGIAWIAPPVAAVASAAGMIAAAAFILTRPDA